MARKLFHWRSYKNAREQSKESCGRPKSQMFLGVLN